MPLEKGGKLLPAASLIFLRTEYLHLTFLDLSLHVASIREVGDLPPQRCSDFRIE